MEIILATRNPSKALQIQAMFDRSRVLVRTLDDVGIVGEAVEDGRTLEENALKKALFAHEKSGGKFWTMADDTGLFISALNGEPGIRAARWLGENVPTEETMQYCIDRLQGVLDRSAIFQTVVALISPDGSRQIFEGAVTGTFLDAPRVPPQPKMPYSSLFVPEGQSKSWAEMTTEEENRISHRGKAFRQVIEYIKAIH